MGLALPVATETVLVLSWSLLDGTFSLSRGPGTRSKTSGEGQGVKTGPGPGLWPGRLTSALCPQNGLLPRDTRYVELYVVTDSAEVVRRSAGAGLGLAGGPRASEGLPSSSSNG